MQKVQIISDLKEIIFTPEENKENKKYVLPDKKNIEINDDFISILKKEIENKLFNEEKGNLKSIILKSISSVLLDVNKELINNIFICGGIFNF